MWRLDTAFLLLSVICLLAGVCLGTHMVIVQNFQLLPVHAHIYLLGWTSLALFGVVYRLYPRAAHLTLARFHFWLAAPGAITFPIGIYLALMHQNPLLAIVSAFCWLASVVTFLAIVVMLVFSPQLHDTRDW
nr:hypothetical protein [uncultured Dongia sp.]